MICKILRLFVTTLAADNKYSPLNRDTLKQPMQMELSQKQKSLSEFFLEFLKFLLIFENFRKTDNSHSRCISAITDSEKRG